MKHAMNQDLTLTPTLSPLFSRQFPVEVASVARCRFFDLSQTCPFLKGLRLQAQRGQNVRDSRDAMGTQKIRPGL